MPARTEARTAPATPQPGTRSRASTLAVTTVLALVAGLLALTAPPAAAQTTYTVTANRITGNPATDDVVDGTCDADCSLRDAVVEANASGGADEIVFAAAGTVALGNGGAGALDTAQTSDLDVTDDLTVTGHPDGTTIDASAMNPSAQNRIFDIDDAPTTLDSLTLTGGRSTQEGGAVRAGSAILTILDSTITANEAMNGGGVHTSQGTLTLTDTVVDANRVAFSGGGVRISNPSTDPQISGSSFTDNLAGVLCCAAEFPAGRGGGLALVADAPQTSVEITRSTFTGNTADNLGNGGGDGGAIHAIQLPFAISASVLADNGVEEIDVETLRGGAIFASGLIGVGTIANTTIDGNQAVEDGGGIYVENSDLVVTTSAITNNRAQSFGDGGTARGGGIFVSNLFTDVVIENTTVSTNSSDAGGAGIDLGAAVINFAQVEPSVVGIRYSTIADNVGEAGLSGEGTAAAFTLATSIIAGNQTANCGGTLTYTSADLNIEDTDTCDLGAAGDLVDTDPVVGPLADNGGADQGAAQDTTGFTHALLDGSPAIDGAGAALCPDPVGTDQRFVPRPQLAGCDIGAYEYQPVEDVDVTKTVDPATIGVGEQATFTITVTGVGDAESGNVVLTDVVPDDLTIDSVTPSAGTCDPPAGQTITCDLGTFAEGDEITIEVVVTGTAEGTYVNTASIEIRLGDTLDDDEGNEDSATLVVTDEPVCDVTGEDGEPLLVDGINRIEGLNRIQTAIAASRAACGEGEAPAIVLTRSDLFPDAQAGTPLAIELGAPLLLSQPDVLSTETEDEIERVLPEGRTVYLLGGTAALSDDVEDRLQTLGYQTVRYGGINRFETAAIIADDGLSNPDTLLVADGGTFAFSILAGAAAANILDGGAVDAAVLLTSGDAIPPETAAYLDGRTGPDPTLIAVGSDAATAYPAAEEVSGPSVFDTSVAVAERFFTDPPAVGIARGDDFPDGLTGGALVGRQLVGPGPILLTSTDALPVVVETYLNDNASVIDRALIFGGTAAVSQGVEDAIASILGF